MDKQIDISIISLFLSSKKVSIFYIKKESCFSNNFREQKSNINLVVQCRKLQTHIFNIHLTFLISAHTSKKKYYKNLQRNNISSEVNWENKILWFLNQILVRLLIYLLAFSEKSGFSWQGTKCYPYHIQT